MPFGVDLEEPLGPARFVMVIPVMHQIIYHTERGSNTTLCGTIGDASAVCSPGAAWLPHALMLPLDLCMR